MRRKVTDRLMEWKNSGREKKCLVIRGARQVGKTYSVDEFARANYGHYLYIDLRADAKAREIFDGNLDSESLLLKLTAHYPGFDFVPGDTLIFLDEIQDCPNARGALKFLSRKGDFDVVASGSLLGLLTKGTASVPVGSEENVDMYPMDFEEFLWAIGLSEKIIDYVKERIRMMEPIDESVLDSMYGYMRWYMVVGGMPEVVGSFVETKRLDTVRRVQKDLLRGYEDDIGSYADDDQKDKVERCFDSIAAQLSKDNKTFVYSDVKDNPQYDVGYKYFGYALNWLNQAHLSLICDCVTQPRLPLEQNAARPRFKLYLLDTGLLMSMYDDSVPSDVLRGGIEVNCGAMGENLVACMLHSQGRRLYYYQKSEPGYDRMELDFVTTVGGRATALEVKTGKKKDVGSLNKAMKTFGIDGIMFETRNVFTDEKGVRHYPMFAAAFMDCIDVPPDVDIPVPDPSELNRRFGQ